MSEGPDFRVSDLVWFDPGIGFPLPGEIQEVHQAAQIIIVNATIDGKVKSALINYTTRRVHAALPLARGVDEPPVKLVKKAVDEASCTALNEASSKRFHCQHQLRTKTDNARWIM
jgi:hypothetical protein